LWRSVRALPEFWRLLELRAVSQFGDGLFQAGLAGGLLFSTERAATPWEIAGSFAVLFLPYSLLGPFAGALLDRWDRRLVLIGANIGRLALVIGVGVLLAAGVWDPPILLGALIVNGFTRFVSSGLSAALPHVVPREQVVAMNSVATATGGAAAFFGASFMLPPAGSTADARCWRYPRCRPRSPACPRTGWRSASTRCWCWSWFATATARRWPAWAPRCCS